MRCLPLIWACEAETFAHYLAMTVYSWLILVIQLWLISSLPIAQPGAAGTLAKRSTLFPQRLSISSKAPITLSAITGCESLTVRLSHLPDPCDKGDVLHLKIRGEHRKRLANTPMNVLNRR
jgi:hypothetical protein